MVKVVGAVRVDVLGGTSKVVEPDVNERLVGLILVLVDELVSDVGIEINLLVDTDTAPLGG